MFYSSFKNKISRAIVNGELLYLYPINFQKEKKVNRELYGLNCDFVSNIYLFFLMDNRV